ncbi:MAG: hypothetical protein IID45_01680 [Planctomycetes bacterium]|nr:hypothetical protein [Planctomycetota bacterium]
MRYLFVLLVFLAIAGCRLFRTPELQGPYSEDILGTDKQVREYLEGHGGVI